MEQFVSSRWKLYLVPILSISVLLGCSQAANEASKQDPIPVTATYAQIQFSIAPDLDGRLCRSNSVSAQLSVDSALPIGITVDCTTNRIEYSATNLAAGPHTFTVELFLYGVLIHRLTAQADLVMNSSLTLAFSSPLFIDSDGDGFSNLAELIAFGRYSGAWLDASLRPPADLPRYSKNYVVTDQLGESFSGGVSGSARYRVVNTGF